MGKEEAISQLRIQEYLDDVSGLDIPHSESQWHHIDVASLLDGTKITKQTIIKNCIKNLRLALLIVFRSDIRPIKKTKEKNIHKAGFLVTKK